MTLYIFSTFKICSCISHVFLYTTDHIFISLYYMKHITALHALEVLDSRGNPTVEVHLCLDNTHRWRAIVPSGASTGTHEALELRDQDSQRYKGKWVSKAIHNIHTTLHKAIVGQSYETIQELDTTLLKLDGTPNKSNLWANALLWISMARCQATAKANNTPLFKVLWTWTNLPIPLINVLNGWAHASTGIDVQECMIVPVWATSRSHAMQMWAEVFQTLKSLLKKEQHPTTVGDEWWFAPHIRTLDEALSLLCKAIEEAWYTTEHIKLALDVAATELYKDGIYHFSREGVTRTWEEMVTWYKHMIDTYPIISIEDGFAEDDIATWIAWTKAFGDACMTVGDDLFVTNVQRLQQWIEQKQANAILIKLNQIGTVSETLEAIYLAQENNMQAIISHRSWETEDSFIADLAVATNAWWIKTWSVCRTDRTAKYNQLTRIDAYIQWTLPVLQ